MTLTLFSIGCGLCQGALHLLFPKVCWACGASLPSDAGSFCRACEAALTTDPHPTCPRCSSTVGPHTHVAEGCPRCRGESFAFASVMRLAPYDGVLREVILRMKSSTGEGLAEVMGRLWAEKMYDRLRAAGADVVVPVPLHWRRRWSRGYNQAETLARAVAQRLRLPYYPRALRRVRDTPRQSLATPDARRVNVRGAFEARQLTWLVGKTILLIDDVLTTGSTASEAAAALRKCGAGRVVVAVLAHD